MRPSGGVKRRRCGKTTSPRSNPLQLQLDPIAATATSMTWGWDFAFPAEEASDYMDNLNLVLAGEMTPEKFAASLPGVK